MGCTASKSTDTKKNPAPTAEVEEVAIPPTNQKQHEVKNEKPEPKEQIIPESQPQPQPQESEPLQDQQFQVVQLLMQDEVQQSPEKPGIILYQKFLVKTIEIDLSVEIPQNITIEKQFKILSSSQIAQWLLYLKDIKDLDILMELLNIKTAQQQLQIGSLYNQQIKQIQTNLLKTHKKFTVLNQIFTKLSNNLDNIIPDLIKVSPDQTQNKTSPLAFLQLFIKAYHIISCLKSDTSQNKVVIGSVSILINTVQDVRELINVEFPSLIINDQKDNQEEVIQTVEIQQMSNEYLSALVEKLYAQIEVQNEESKYNVDVEYIDVRPQVVGDYESYKKFTNKRK